MTRRMANIWRMVMVSVVTAAIASIGSQAQKGTGETSVENVAIHDLAATDSATAGDISKVYVSGYQKSGEGSNFSQWYAICATPPLDDYVVEFYSFSLEGDRSCGAWAECRLKVQTPTSVCYEYRMQGHSEWGQGHVGPFVFHDGNGVGMSQGVLTVNWQLQ
jgi:hypothetical protein